MSPDTMGVPVPATRARRDRIPPHTWGIVVAFWTVLGLVESTKAYVSWQLRETPRSWAFVLAANMPWWYVWMLLTPAVLLLARRVRLDGERWRSALAIHAAASFVASIAHLLIEGTIFHETMAWYGMPVMPLRMQLAQFLNAYLMSDLLTYWAVAGGYFALEYYRRYRDGALVSARLEAESARLALGLAEARVQALRMELNPHFLFNTLNAISGLVRRAENARAVDMLARLGELLRATLDRDMAPLIPLEEELAILDRYLDIERVRFGDRLTIEIDVEPDALDALVPALVLQPLVENAIRHGVTRRPGDALVRIAARRADATIELEVRDTGRGLPSDVPGALREGVGLSNTRQRLAELYGDAASLRLGNAPGGGARVDLVLPFQPRSERAHVAIGA
jgi:signal transduction histidine kinase